MALPLSLAACGDGGGSGGIADVAPTTASPTGGTTTGGPDGAAAPGASAAPAGPVRLGPEGYGALKLGMTREAAEATGLITIKSEPPGGAGCGSFDLKEFPREGPYGGGSFSPDLGIARIAAAEGVRTPEGIAVGASAAEIEKAYPELREGPNLSFTAVPGNPKAQYTFLIVDGRAKELALDLANQNCSN
ncbi:hypothetical protein [Actinomadura sp. CNU-125]|uniref:hypothetical protein n=1 Tax=Actinomadura sp. CNU-125 TaxID=1904961 RepID=UPI0011789A4C|nr:hypothetical protein [Actinomadura sp. CNU-125]